MFSIGQKVRICSLEKLKSSNTKCGVIPEMWKYAGRVFKIRGYHISTKYVFLEGAGGWIWEDCLLTAVDDGYDLE